MNFYDISWQLADLIEGHKSVFVRMEPEAPDFTTGAKFKIVVWAGNRNVTLEVDRTNIGKVASLFDFTIFDKDQIDRLYFWNIKSFNSYLQSSVSKTSSPTTNIIDLKIIENFLGIKKRPPENLAEAVDRTKFAVRNRAWPQFQKLYKAIYLPLSLKVLPSIESTGLLNEEIRKPVYPYYEIEGQTNGRMNCLKKFAWSYLPHNMGPDVKSVLIPEGHKLRFLIADFCHCEVTVLQWLSGDTKLKEILDSGEDLHKRIYEIITEDVCDSENKRNISKKIFLPVMFGCGAKGLASNIGVTEEVGEVLFNRIKIQFPIAFNWMAERQKEAKRGPISDYFGRPRHLQENESYLARNFSVQGVAATVCMEKLILLHHAIENQPIKLAFSVHDGYGLYCGVSAAKESYQIVKHTLESESKLCPGLKMKVEIKFGPRLNKIKVLWRN